MLRIALAIGSVRNTEGFDAARAQALDGLDAGIGCETRRMAGSLDTLTLETHFAGNLLGGEAIAHVHDWLLLSDPKLAGSLEVHAYERDKERIVLKDDPTRSLLSAVAERGLSRGETYRELVASYGGPGEGPRQFGDVMVRGRGSGASGRYISVRFDSLTPLMPIGANWLWSNSVGASISTSRASGKPREVWIRELGDVLAGQPGFLWGAAYVRAEFEDSNLDTSGGGLRAIGRDASVALPGLYWLNYFGSMYLPLLRVAAAQVAQVGHWFKVGDAVGVQCHDLPEEWQEHQARTRRLRDALGSDLFFDRKNPDAPCRAPDFGVTRIVNPKSPLQAFTSDGINLTEVPPESGPSLPDPGSGPQNGQIWPASFAASQRRGL